MPSRCIFANSGSSAAMDNASNKPRGFSLLELVVVLIILGILAALLLPAMRTAGPSALRTQCRNNIGNIALALHEYESAYGALPPAYTVDASGKRLHSWRTLILPFMGHPSLYQKIDLSKPWYDPANAEVFLTANIVDYSCASAKLAENQTLYLAVVTPNSCLRPREPRPLSDVKDDPGKTLMLIEVDSEHAVPWMAPNAV